MAVNRKTLITLALVAVVGVGLVGAYRSSACDESKASSTCSSKTNKTSAMHASAGDCCKSAGMVKQASAGKGECPFSKGASAKKMGGGSDCCAAKGAMQASAGAGMGVIPIGAGSGCPHGAMQASGGSCSAHGANAFTDDCDGCKMYKKYWTSLENAQREVVTLPDGILVHMTSDDPAVVADLQKYAAEKADLMHAIANKTFTGKLCELCQERSRTVQGASFRVANSTNGVYTVITSGAPETVEQLHKIAEAESATKMSVNG